MSGKKCGGACMSRRCAVEAGARLGIAVAATAVSVGIVSACGTQSNRNNNGDAGTAVPVASGVATLSFAAFPNLQNAGGSYRVNINGNPVSVTRISTSAVAAVVATCTHQGATLNDYADGGFTCPRHGATFTADGTVTGGPAGSNLTKYQATIGTTGITVNVG